MSRVKTYTIPNSIFNSIPNSIPNPIPNPIPNFIPNPIPITNPNPNPNLKEKELHCVSYSLSLFYTQLIPILYPA